MSDGNGTIPRGKNGGRLRRVPLKEIATTWNWHGDVELSPSDETRAFTPDDLTLIAAATMELANRKGVSAAFIEQWIARIGNLLSGMAGDLDRLVRIASGPTAAKSQKQEKLLREKASRDRAMAAYIKAGGKAESIADLGLSNRAVRGMNRLEIKWACELTEYTSDQLLKLKNFGQTTLDEVRQKLAAAGLCLQGEEAKTS